MKLKHLQELHFWTSGLQHNLISQVDVKSRISMIATLRRSYVVVDSNVQSSSGTEVPCDLCK